MASINERIAYAKQLTVSLAQTQSAKLAHGKLRVAMSQELYPSHLASFTIDDRGEHDAFDDSSLVVLAYSGSEVVGGGRVILSAPGGFTEQEEAGALFDDFHVPVPLSQVAELGRLYVVPHYRGHGVALAIWRARLFLLHAHQITHVFVKFRPAILDYYKRLGLNFRVVSRPYSWKGVENVTSFTELASLLKDLETANPPFYEFSMDTTGLDPSIPVEAALEKVKIGGWTLPAREQDGRRKTMNFFGFEAPAGSDAATEAFMTDIRGLKVLEIGCAYGNVMHSALHGEVAAYTALDIDERHVCLAASDLVHSGFSDEHIGRVRFVAGAFPTTFFPTNSFDRILATRVFHFFDPETLQDALHEIRRILAPGGLFFLLGASPYMNYHLPFIDEYERRLAAGHPHPGYVEDWRDWINPALAHKPQNEPTTPAPFTFLEPRYLEKLCGSTQLVVQMCKLVPVAYANAVWTLDGRENVLLIASK